MELVAKKAVELLLEKLKGRNVQEKTFYIEPVLKIEESCGCTTSK